MGYYEAKKTISVHRNNQKKKIDAVLYAVPP